MKEVLVKKLRPEAILPNMATIGSAGADIRACLYEEETGEKITKIVIPSGGRTKIHTGLAFQLPTNHVMLIDVRSSSGVKKGLELQNTIGVLDSDYTGECCLFIKNTLDHSVEIEDGERIAQVIVLEYPQVKYVQVEELEKTERGDGGFGSTGKF